jgi:hypothetical protein
MIKDEILPASVVMYPPESDQEALERVSQYAGICLAGLTDLVFADVDQLKRALAELNWKTGKTDVLADIGRKKILYLRPVNDSIRYEMWIEDTPRQCRVIIAQIDRVPKDLKDEKDRIEGILQDL